MTQQQGLGWYLDEIGRVPLLTPAEELHLGATVRTWLDHPDGPDDCPPAIRRRGLRARDRFVQANLRLSVSYVSKRCSRLVRSADLDDLIQAANLGLLRAVERFDPTRGYKFSTYAYWWIRQACNRWLSTSARLLKLPGQHSQLLYQLTIAAREYLAATGRQPTIEQLATVTGLTTQRISTLLESSKSLTSLDQDVGNACLGDLLAASEPAAALDDTAEVQWLRRHLLNLPPLERDVLDLLYGFHGNPRNAVEVAKVLGLPGAREVRQMERQAIAQLREIEQKAPPRPELFADRIGPQLLLDLPCPGDVLRRRTRQRRRDLQLRHAPDCAVDQLLLVVDQADPI